MGRERIAELAEILKDSETADLEPPYRCLPPGDAEWYRQKAARLIALGYTRPAEPLEDKVEAVAQALFERAIERGQQAAKDEGLDKIDMMPHKSQWVEMGGEDKDWWREEAKANIEIIHHLFFPMPERNYKEGIHHYREIQWDDAQDT